MAEKGQVALVALCVLLCWIPVHGRADFRPAPNVVHGDHDDEHVGYALSVRMHTLNNGVTVDQADQAVDGYLFELTKRDDLIVFAGFYDSTASRYVTAATWRTEAGADASRNAALGVGTGNYLSKMAESSYYLGTVNHFIELLEIHSAVLLGNAAIVRITTLANPSRYNETTMEPTIENVTLPFAEGLVGLLDYTTVFPNQPTSNTHFVTMSSWNTSADAVSGKADLNAHYAATYPGHFSSDSVYEGSIRNFWHSSPGTTPPLPGAGCKATPGPWVLFPTVLAACVAAITLA